MSEAVATGESRRHDPVNETNSEDSTLSLLLIYKLKLSTIYKLKERPIQLYYLFNLKSRMPLSCRHFGPCLLEGPSPLISADPGAAALTNGETKE